MSYYLKLIFIVNKFLLYPHLSLYNMGFGAYSTNYIVLSIISVTILGGFLLYNSPDAEAIPISFPPTSIGTFQEWAVSAGSDSLTSQADTKDSTYIISSSNNQRECFNFDTFLPDALVLNGGITMEVRALKIVPQGVTSIKMGPLFNGAIDQGEGGGPSINFKLKTTADDYTRFFADIDTVGEVHEREWCVVMQTDASPQVS